MDYSSSILRAISNLFNNPFRWFSLTLLLAISIGGVQAQMVVSLNGGWEFLMTDCDASSPEFDDSSFMTVQVPHTWNALDGQDGGDNYKRGIGWYRKVVSIPAVAKGKVIYLDFAASNLQTKVYVNGKFVSEHLGGYAHFTCDITSAVTPGKHALIAVQVDNSSKIDAPPLSADFTFFGGITRSVSMVIENPVHINPVTAIHSKFISNPKVITSKGVKITASNISDTSADVFVRTALRNASPKKANLKVEVVITDKEGATVASASSTTRIVGGDTTSVLVPLKVINPRLWNGINDPYLYAVNVVVKDKGKVVSRVTEPLGIRYFSVDPDKGFLLNGKPYPLHGIAIHDEVKDKGRAVSDEDRRRDIDMMLETGANYLRLSHYQHGDFTYNYLDSLGIVCWTEIPLINKVSHTKHFADNCASQLCELIGQLYNHPCVFFWGVCNEIRNKQRDKPEAIAPLIRNLADIVKELDASRLSTLACNYQSKENAYTDLYSWNKYWGWYNGGVSNIAQIDGYRKFTNTPMGLSEYGAGGNVVHHEVFPGNKPVTTGQWHPEEYQAYFHEVHLEELKKRPWLWQTSVWVGFDFASDSRDEGGTPGINDKGLVTHNRRIKKDAYYLYKANWNTKEPFVHINSRRHNPLRSNIVTVRAYSNCASVRLIVNGERKGEIFSNNHIFVWNDIQFNAGKNTVVAEAVLSDGSLAKDSVVWVVEENK